MIDYIRDTVDLTNVPVGEWREKYIGDGYRSCCYIKRSKSPVGEIILFGYDRNNEPKAFRCPWRCHIAYNVQYKTSTKDIFGRYVAYKYFDTSSERRRYVDSIGGTVNIIECLKPENEFLHAMFDDVALDENFNKQNLRIHYFDIETEISDSFEYPSTARNRINMMTVYDTKTEMYYTWSLKHCEKRFNDEYCSDGKLVNESPIKDVPKDRFVVFEFSDSVNVLSNDTVGIATSMGGCGYSENEIETARKLYRDACNEDERKMLRHFVDWIEKNCPDVLCAHNGQAYDFPYLVNRIERVLGNPVNVDDFGKDIGNGRRRNNLSEITRRLSPVGNVRVRKNNLDNERANVQAEIVVDIDGIFLADTLVLYRDKYKINQPLDGGNGLDNIGEVELGAHKIHYDGTLKELYENNWDKFYFYNVIDVDLLRRVEEKVKMIPLSRSITSSGLTNYGAIYSSISYLMGSLAMFSKTQMGTIFTSYKGNRENNTSIEGAYVFPPEPGMYNGGICTVDFASLYPSSIRALGICISTYCGKISRFPIDDPSGEFFMKEPPIDLNGTDVIGSVRSSDDEKEYSEKYKNRFSTLKSDWEIDKFYLLLPNGTGQKVITRKQLDRLLDEKCIFTRNNTLFLKHSVKKGVISTWSKEFYALRKKTKKKMQKLEMELYNKLVPEDKISETKAMIENLNARQQSIKIQLNSLYGCIATPFSPAYNPYIAQTITRNGKFCNLSASVFIKKWMKEKYGISDSYISTVSGDTDSSFYYNKVRITVEREEDLGV